MKAIFFKKESKVIIKDIKQPSVGSGDVLVKMESCGICGSDVEKVFGKYSMSSMSLGHEPSGIIIRTGKKITGFKNGDRVFVHHHVPCYSCEYCFHNNETMCKKYCETNILPCGLSEQFLVPEWNVSHGGIIKIPDTMTFDQATMIEPLACCIRAWKKILFNIGDSIAILGAGTTGLMHVMLSNINKFDKVICIDTNNFRLNFAKKIGAIAINYNDPKKHEKIDNQTNSYGVDVVIVATSNIKAFLDAVNLVKKGGKIILFGAPQKNTTTSINWSTIYSKELSIIPSYASSDRDIRDALFLIKSSKIDVSKLVTHKYPILDSQKAFNRAYEGNNSIKIIITK